MRSLRAAVLALTLSVVALAGCASSQRMPAPPTGGPLIKAMAFNVLFSFANDDANLRAIASEAPDVLCVREATERFMLKFLNRFGDQYPHRRFRPHPGQPSWGVAIASKLPLKDWRAFKERPYYIPGADAVIETPGGELRLVCVHLIPPVARYRRSETFFQTMQRTQVLRRRQAKYLQYRYRDEPRPVVMLGDFNAEEDEPSLQYLASKGFVNSCEFEAGGCQRTWPGFVRFLPARFRFDHILGRGVSFQEAAVVLDGGSDHYPVVATFEIPRAASAAATGAGR